MDRFTILDHAPIGQFVLDKDFTVLFWNRCMETWSGISREHIVGSSLFALFPHLQEPKYAGRIKSIFNGGPPIVFSSQLHKHIIPMSLPDGTFRILYAVITSVPSNTGPDFFAIFSIQDVTSLTSALDTSRTTLKQLKQEIEERKKTEKDLEKANQAKSEFLANLSHELRSPLNSLLVLSQILAENENGNLNAEEVEYASTIHSSGSDLLTLINDLLDLAKVEAAKMEISVDCLDLQWLRDDIKRKYGPMAEQKGLAFSVELAPEVPRYIMTDSQRLAQILRNLISNSFKFTHAGSVEVTICLSETTQDAATSGLEPADTLIFAVTDTGIGIPEDKLQLIFEAFTQADGSTTRKYGGTGLGLSISKEFSRLLGGEIQVHSIVGKGSVFAIHLPCTVAPADETLLLQTSELDKSSGQFIAGPGREAGAVERRRFDFDRRGPQRPQPESASGRRMVDISRHIRPQEDNSFPQTPAAEPEQPPKTTRIFQNKTILIVEDDMRNVFTFMNILKKQGVKVLVGKNGREGLDRLSDTPGVDLVLMDIMMPLMDGYTAMQEIRKMEGNNRQVPILALTAKAMPGDREKCLEAGANDYLAKPVAADMLLEKIRNLLPS